MRCQDWLVESFLALDRVYFDDRLADRGILVKWKKWTHKKIFLYGVCHTENQPPVIHINRVLAHPDVPSYVTMSTLYHECLHALLGPKHDLAFHLSERRFVHQFESDAWIRANEKWLHNLEV